MRMIALILLGLTSGWAHASLTIGTTSGYAPFVSLTPEGVYEGFDIDVAHLIAKKLGKTVVIQDYGSMAGLMLALKQKKVDMLLWAISITKSRQQAMEMVHYQGEKVSDISILYQGDETPLASCLKGSMPVVCVESGTFQEAALTRMNPFKLKFVTHITDGILELRYKKCQGVAVDRCLIPRFCRQYPQFKVMHLELPEEEQSGGHGICLRKEETALIQQVQAAVKMLIEEKAISQLEKKWGLEG
ncbi:MAG: transporter substrate-binding domain-containing protein [Candidatus Rhabdochlamydia sp.]